MRKFSLGNALRLAVTVLTFAAIVWWVGPGEIAAAFNNVVWFWVVIRVIPYAASLWVQARRWNFFLSLEGVTTDTNRLFRRIWMGRFFANTMPGSIGGDIFRVVESGDFADSRMAVARSLLLDRVVALVSLGVYTSFACLIWARLSNWHTLEWVAALGLIVSIVLLCLLGTLLPSRILHWFAQRLPAGRIHTFFSTLADRLRDLAGQRQLLLGAALVTVIYNLTWAISSYCAFLAFNLSISPLLVVTLIPVVYAVTSLPISINGMGVAESAFILVFTAVGLAPGEAAAVAILLRVTGLIMSSFGGVLYLLERRRLGRASSVTSA